LKRLFKGKFRPSGEPRIIPGKNAPINDVTVLRRTRLIAFLLGVVMFLVLVGQLFKVQMVDYEKYQQRAVSQQTRNEIITPGRGAIFDRNMKELAISASVETVVISPADIEDDEEARLIAQGLSDILGIDYNTIYEKTQKKASYHQYIQRKVEKEIADQVRQFIVDNELSGAVSLQDDTKRYYPYGNFASHVLGFCGTDNNGLYGIEYQFDSVLAGEPGRVIAAKNAQGVDMPYEYEQYYDATDGDSVVLTIDEVIQHYLEKHLETAYASTNAQNGVYGIVMDVNTGEILAMANKPDFDLNDPFTITDESTLLSLSVMDESLQAAELKTIRENLWRNKAVNDTYEPGSVFKIITGAMAVEENVVSQTETFNCSGYMHVGDRDIGCWQTNGHGTQTFAEGVMHSCNPVFMTLGQRIGATTFFKYFQAFGFTSKTGIELPGESGGSSVLYHDATGLKVPTQLANSAFGQTFKASPLQVISAVSAVANGGILYQPTIIKQIVGADGTVKQDFSAEPIRQVVTSETSEIMNDVLELVVSGETGTGKNAYVKGYQVCGKTGTSQKMDKLNTEGGEDLRIASFLGYAPAWDPQIAVLIVIDEPMTSIKGGGYLAGPVVANVLADVLPYLNIEPRYTAEEAATLDVYTPNFIGMTRQEAQKKAESEGLTIRFSGEEDVITDQIPAAGSVVPKNIEMVLYAGKYKSSSLFTVPNITGMTLGGIRRLLDDSVFYVRAVGAKENAPLALSVNQIPAYGERVEMGTVITVEFIDKTQTIE